MGVEGGVSMNAQSQRCCCALLMRVRLLPHALVLLFGTCAWLSINAVYVQLPLLSVHAPESWNLASYIVVIIQLSCVCPFAYSVLRIWCKHAADRIEPLLVVFLLAIDVAGLLLSTLTYETRTTIGTTEHSLWLFISIFILCIPCTMADVVFMPLIGRLGSPAFITTFYIGMGIGALIPSALAFAQAGDGSGYNFSYSVFMYIICVFVFISLGAYLVLASTEILPKATATESDASHDAPLPATCSRVESLPIVASLVASAFQNSIVPSILPYAAQSYAANTYSLSSNLFVLTNPAFCLLNHVASFASNGRLRVLAALSSLPILLILLLSITPLPGMPAALLPTSAALSAGLLSLLRTAAAARLAHSSHPKALFYCGFATQVGSFAGAISIFILANVGHVFISS